jgi:hypothetical protein
MMILSGTLLQAQTISENEMYHRNNRFDVISEKYEIFIGPCDGMENVITPLQLEYFERASSHNRDSYLIIRYQ